MREGSRRRKGGREGRVKLKRQDLELNPPKDKGLNQDRRLCEKLKGKPDFPIMQFLGNKRLSAGGGDRGDS